MRDDNYEIPDQQSGNLRDFLTVLFKHKYMIVIVFLATAGTVTIGTFLLPPIYEAKSSLLVKFGREYVYRPEMTDKAPMISVNQEEAINSEINIMTSRDLMEKVILALQVKTIYPDLLIKPSASIAPLDAAILEFGRKLSVEVVKKSNVLQVTFQHKDPRIAAKAVNLLIDVFKEKHLQVYNGQESQFLEKQLTAYEQKLKDSEDSLQDFKQLNQVYSLDEQRGLLLKQRMELDSALKSSQSHIDGLRKRLSSLNSQMQQLGENKGRYTQTERDKIIVDAKAQLLNLQLKERELLGKYADSSRLVTNVRKEITMVTEFLRQQEEDISGKVKTSNLVYQEAEKEALLAEAELSSESAREKTLSRQLSQLEGEIKALDLNEKRFQILKRVVAINDRNYRAYVDRFEEARISDNMNRQKLANLSVIQAATAPAKPIKPKKLINVILGVILGALSGLGCAFFSEYASQGLSTPENAEKRLGLPVLATVALKA